MRPKSASTYWSRNPDLPVTGSLSEKGQDGEGGRRGRGQSRRKDQDPLLTVFILSSLCGVFAAFLHDQERRSISRLTDKYLF